MATLRAILAEGAWPGMERRAADRPAAGSPAPAGDPWAGFLAGPENALAMAAAQALAGGRREGLSPLVVHGPAGVGKTRLLDALAGAWGQWQPVDRPALRLDAESFAAACAAAGRRTGDWAALRERFRRPGLFVLDDLDALRRSPMAVDELAFTLDELDAADAAVAVATRTPPGRWIELGLPARLANRLLGGLAVRIEPPGPDLRRRYVLDRSRVRGPALAAEAIDVLIAGVEGFRELDGALARLALEARLRPAAGREGPLPAARVAAAIEGPDAPADSAWTVAAVAKAVAVRFRVPLRDLRSASRRAAVVEPRHLAIYLAREWTGTSYAALGAYFGRRDPATVRHACRMAAERLAASPELAAAVAAIGSAPAGR